MKHKPRPDIVTTQDLFVGYDPAKLKGEGNIKRIYKCSDKKELARKIFSRYLYLMMLDFIEGGRTFVFPSSRHAELRWRVQPDATFKKSRSFGRYSDVDVLASGFKNYEIILYYRCAGKIFLRPFRISSLFRNRVVEKINSGFKYC